MLFKTKKDREQFDAWLDTLYAGTYKKGVGTLQPTDDSYCCLGVGCLVTMPKDELEIGILGKMKGSLPIDQVNAPEWLKNIANDFQATTGIGLTALNDKVGELPLMAGSIGEGTSVDLTGEFSHQDIAILLDLVYNFGALYN